jgi:hypothetical protein
LSSGRANLEKDKSGGSKEHSMRSVALAMVFAAFIASLPAEADDLLQPNVDPLAFPPPKEGLSTQATDLTLPTQDQDTAETVDTAVFIIPREQLATQSNSPFMDNGKIVDEGSRSWNEYQDAIERFPDAGACLVAEAQGKDPIDLAKFNWQVFETFAELEVCLSRIGTTIGDNEDFAAWLQLQGYTVKAPREYDKAYTQVKDVPGKVYYTWAYIRFDDFKQMTPIYSNLWFVARWWLWNTSLHSAHVLTMEDGTVVDIQARTNAD